VSTWEVDLRTGAVAWSEMLEALHGLPTGCLARTFEAFLDAFIPKIASLWRGQSSVPRGTIPTHTSCIALSGPTAPSIGSAPLGEHLR
jgi:hypothetical protein